MHEAVALAGAVHSAAVQQLAEGMQPPPQILNPALHANPQTPPEQLPTPLAGLGQLMGVPTQLPCPSQASPVVHAFPSLQVVPAAAHLVSHAQSPAFQKPTTQVWPVEQFLGVHPKAEVLDENFVSSVRVQAEASAPSANSQRRLFMHPSRSMLEEVWFRLLALLPLQRDEPSGSRRPTGLDPPQREVKDMGAELFGGHQRSAGAGSAHAR